MGETDTVINLDSRRTLDAAMEAVQAGQALDAEKIADGLLVAYGDGPGIGPDIVRTLARQFISDLVRAEIEKRMKP